jgi:hypothetical protein
VDARFESGIKADVEIAACPDVTTRPCLRALRNHAMIVERVGGRELEGFLSGFEKCKFLAFSH